MLLLAACQTSQPPEPTSPPGVLKTTVFVIFEGPWAIVGDPNDANSVLVLAPKTKSHRDLNVSASNDSTLAAGVYELSVPAHGTVSSAPLDASFAQAKIPAKNLQHALDDKSGRYVIRLPKPQAYVAAKRTRSRVGPNYPPDPATEQNYATEVSFRYDVSSMNGFSLSGTPDTGIFNPLLLQLDTPIIRFAIEPAQMDDPADQCETHSRETFRDVVKFLGITLFIDFPGHGELCHKTDPQIRASTQAAVLSQALNSIAAMSLSEKRDAVTKLVNGTAIHQPGILASIDSAGRMMRYFSAAMYLFHYNSADCRTAIIFLSITP